MTVIEVEALAALMGLRLVVRRLYLGRSVGWLELRPEGSWRVSMVPLLLDDEALDSDVHRALIKMCGEELNDD